MARKLHKIWFILFLFFHGTAIAQTSAGTDFWISSTYPFYGTDTFLVTVASQKPTKVYLEIPLLNYKDSLSLGFNEIKNFVIPPSIRTSYYYYYSGWGSNNGKGLNGIHVFSKQPIRTYAFSQGRWYSCGATAVFPTNTNPPNGIYFPYKARYYSGPSYQYRIFFFSIVGIDDSVTVKINTNQALWGLPPGNKTLLRRGEVIRLYTYIFGQDPILSVEATGGKRICVFTENFYDYTGDGCFNYDLMYEQILPNSQLGMDYIFTPLKFHKKGYDFTFIATEDNTEIKKANAKIATLDSGESYYGRIYGDSALEFKCSKPCNAFQKSIVDTCGYYWWGYFNGPSIISMSTNDQLVEDAVVTVPVTNSYTANYINFICTQYSKDECYFDGNLIPSSSFKQVPGTNYYYFADTIEQGNHRIINQKGFIAYIYGKGAYGSYAYNASSGLRNLQRVILSKIYKSCDTGFIVRLTTEGDPGKDFKWTFNNQQDTGLVAYFNINKPGTYVAKCVYTRLRNNTLDSTSVVVEVKGNTPFPVFTGNELNYCKANEEFVFPNSKLFSYLWSDGSTSNKRSLSVTGKYSLIITNNASGCKFYDTADISFFSPVLTDFSVIIKKACQGYPIYLDNKTQINSPDSIKKYDWFVDNQPAGKLRNDTVKYAYPGKYKFKLTVTTKKGCIDSAIRYGYISASPIVISGVKTNDSCYNRANFKFQSRSGIIEGKVAGYQWIFSDGDTNFKSRQAIKDFKDSGLYWYRFSAYSEEGCADTTAKKWVRVYGAPSPAFEAIDSSVCKNGNYFKFKNLTNTKGRDVGYDWMWGDGTGQTFTQPDPKNYDDTGTYKVQLVGRYTNTGCTDTATRWVKVLLSPKANFVLDSSNWCLNKNYFQFSDKSNARGSNFKTITWKWGDGSSTIDTFSPRKNFSKTGTFRVSMYFSTGKGCMDSFKRNYTVYQNPIATIAVPDSINCGASNYFNFNFAGTAAGNARYSWSFGNNTLSSLKNPGKKTYAGFGNFKTTLAVFEPLYGCSDSAFYSATVLKKPKLQLKVDDTIVCTPDLAFHFEDTTEYGNVTPQRIWYFDNQLTDSIMQKKGSKTFTAHGLHTLHFIGGIPNVCADTIQKDLRVLYSNSSPIAKLQLTKDKTCAPAYLSASATLNVVETKWRYAYRLENAVFSTKTVQNFKAETAKTYTFLLELKDSNQCTFNFKDSITILPKPELQIQNSTLDSQCFKGHQFQMGSSLQNATAPIFYQWQNGANSANLNNVQFSNDGKKQFVLTVEDKNQCKDTATYDVLLYTSPSIQFTANHGCEDEVKKIVANVTPNNSVKYIHWYIDNAFAASGNTYNLTYTPVGKKSMIAMVATHDGCTDTTIPQVVEVFAKPKAHIAYTLNKPLSNGIRADFRDSSEGAAQYKWILSNGQTFSSKNASYVYPKLGKEKIILYVYSNQGCEDSTSSLFDLKSDELAWIPTAFSPDGDGLNDFFGAEKLTAIKSYHMKIYNRWGQKLFETKDATVKWDGTFMGEAVPEGVYGYEIHLRFLTGKAWNLEGSVIVIR